MLDKVKRIALTGGIAAGGLALGPTSAHALGFAAFTGTDQTVVASEVNGALTISVANDPVLFQFGVKNIDPALQSQSAFLSYTLTTTLPATPIGPLDLDPVSTAFTMTFTRATPYQGLSNLLTVTYNPVTGEMATVQGTDGASSASLLAGGYRNQDPSNVVFSSDFVDFTGTTQHSLAVSYTLGTDQFVGIDDLTGLLTSFDDNGVNLAGFQAVESGNFGSTPPPAPIFTASEPTGLAILGLGALAVLVARGRRSIR